MKLKKKNLLNLGTVPKKSKEKSEMNVYRPNEERMKTNGKRISVFRTNVERIKPNVKRIQSSGDSPQKTERKKPHK